MHPNITGCVWMLRHVMNRFSPQRAGGSAGARASSEQAARTSKDSSRKSSSSCSRQQEAAAGGQEELACCGHCGMQSGASAAGAGGRVKLMRCRGCRAVWYCGMDWQRSHWPQHKAACKAAAQRRDGMP